MYAKAALYNPGMVTQTWDPTIYQRDAGFVAALGAPLLAVLAPQPHERILDLGCGDGALTVQLAASGAAVVGVDSSPTQIAAATKRGLDARVIDGHALSFENEFDAVFSNAALHWMLEPTRVIAAVERALKPGGRFVGEMGGVGNVESVVSAYSAELADRSIAVGPFNPWYFPSADEYAAHLAQAGFVVNAIGLFARPTPLPGDVGDWLRLMTQSFLNAIPESGQASLVAQVRDRIRPQILREDGVWELDYVRLRFTATRR